MVNETAFNCTNVQRAITSSEEVEKSVYRSNCSLKKKQYLSIGHFAVWRYVGVKKLLRGSQNRILRNPQFKDY